MRPGRKPGLIGFRHGVVGSLVEPLPANGDHRQPGSGESAAQLVVLRTIREEVLPSAAKLVDPAVGASAALLEGCEYSDGLPGLRGLATIESHFSSLFSERVPKLFIKVAGPCCGESDKNDSRRCLSRTCRMP